MTNVIMHDVPYTVKKILHEKTFTYEQMSNACSFISRYNNYEGVIMGDEEKDDFLFAYLIVRDVVTLRKLLLDYSVTETVIDGSNFATLIPLLARGISGCTKRTQSRTSETEHGLYDDDEIDDEDYPIIGEGRGVHCHLVCTDHPYMGAGSEKSVDRYLFEFKF